jgi:hypothetical protein
MDPTSDSDSPEQSDSVSSDPESSEEYVPGSDESDSGSGQSECSDVDEAAEESDGEYVELREEESEEESEDDQPQRKRVTRKRSVKDAPPPALKRRKASATRQVPDASASEGEAGASTSTGEADVIHYNRFFPKLDKGNGIKCACKGVFEKTVCCTVCRCLCGCHNPTNRVSFCDRRPGMHTYLLTDVQAMKDDGLVDTYPIKRISYECEDECCEHGHTDDEECADGYTRSCRRKCHMDTTIKCRVRDQPNDNSSVLFRAANFQPCSNQGCPRMEAVRQAYERALPVREREEREEREARVASGV